MNQIAIMESLIEALKNQSMILEQQVNDLKCCGNCISYSRSNKTPCAYFYCWQCCKDWQRDGLEAEDRQEETWKNRKK